MYSSGAEKELEEMLRKMREEMANMTGSLGRPYTPTRAGYDGAMHTNGMYTGLAKTALNYGSKPVNEGIYGRTAINYGGLGKGAYGGLAARVGYGGLSGKAGYASGKGSGSYSGSSGSSGGK